MNVEVCPHGVSREDFCEPCAHYREEEWAGYSIFICAWCQQPWPCDYEQNQGGGGL